MCIVAAADNMPLMKRQLVECLVMHTTVMGRSLLLELQCPLPPLLHQQTGDAAGASPGTVKTAAVGACGEVWRLCEAGPDLEGAVCLQRLTQAQ